MASSSSIPLPEGVVIDPSDEEFVFYYLMGKVYGSTDGAGFRFVEEKDVYGFEPPMLSCSAPNTGHSKMFFFTQLRKKNQNGKTIDRQAPGGFWRKTGSPSYVKDKNGERAATKASLVYYKKDQMTSTPVKTQWLMKEYMLLESEFPDSIFSPWTLCVVYQYKATSES